MVSRPLLAVVITAITVAAVLLGTQSTPALAVCGGLANSSDVPICEGGSGTFLPAFNKVGEASWPNWLKIILYLVGLLWTFSGIGIITDVFMEAIEIITSDDKEILVQGADGNMHPVSVKVWNPTIANLSLMALGSSAPEIILSLIEIVVSNDFFAGALGPSTIVGSAAFNLFVIIAVCITAIPKGETRRLENFGVFIVTALFSLFAYIWLILILVVISPNVIELWEGLVTLFFFPVLLGLSYAADKGYLSWFKRRNDADNVSVVEFQEEGKEPIVFHHNFDSNLIIDEVARCKSVSNGDKANYISSQRLDPNTKSRAWFRVNATRRLVGSHAIMPDYEKAHQQDNEIKGALFGTEQDAVSGKQYFYLLSTKKSVPEGAGHVSLEIGRVGAEDTEAFVSYYTKGVTATMGTDFEETKGILTFAPGEIIKTVDVKIIDDDEEEDDEVFLFHIHEPSSGYVVHPSRCTSHVVIIDDDHPGSFEFEFGAISCRENCGQITIPVIRVGGSKGKIGVRYHTSDGKAFAPHDYFEAKGALEFEDGELEKVICVKIVDDNEFEEDEDFKVVLEEVDGVKLGLKKTCTVTILNEDGITSVKEKIASLLNINLHRFRVGGKTWKGQFADAIEWPERGSGKLAIFMHIINLPWKIIAACIPPTLFGRGWVAFTCALMVIGIVTAIIGDIASLMGCAMGLKDSVTAITFVALGTSLPDTFASKTAAIASKTADAAVTNVTGSNSVNVFLGLGLSWAIASIYWTIVKATDKWVETVPSCISSQYPNGAFWVPAGDLAFSVIVFSVCCVLCLLTLLLRRFALGYELGGKYTKPTAVFFVFLWLVYVLLSSFKTYEYF
eukprot:m.9801 g.9801  ORF g.9801 m.9801 type:complete len:844 (+) comp3559_c0_seq1:53-2584(+)